MKIARAIAKRTRDLLARQKITQYKLEKEMAIPHRTLLNITGAKHDSANLKTIFQICKGLNISVGEFFSDPIFADPTLEID